MVKVERRRFDRQFKIEAVKLIIHRGTPLAQVARDLGINENVLYRWKKQFQDDPQQSFPGKGHLKATDEELYRLRKRLADVEQERDILKKALAIFSKEPK
ncbi:MAG TPA: transposase [Thermodesulfobacteriota bacterium]|nr:transposase [Thermodesulfobacteriota bacterium]HNU71321.1 transposase [Thermodesulfobacteriota bacterium]